jgi:hypothetical protein
VEAFSAVAVLLLLFVPLAVAIALWKRKRRIAHGEILARVEASAERTGEENEAQNATERWLSLRDSFPFLPTPEVRELTGEEIRAAIRRTLTEGGSLGSVEGWPAPLLPAEERRRHLYVSGKTGSGKSTFLEHLLLSDLRANRGVGLIGPEGELFSRVLGLVPKKRIADLIYFAPGNPACPLSFNPLSVDEGEDQSKAAEDLFTTFKRVLHDDLGPRMEPILQNAFAALVGRGHRTFWDVRRILSDTLFRREVTEGADPYVRDFWRDTYPRFPEGASLPILSRLDQFLRPPAIRNALTRPLSSFSFKEILGGGKILLVDLSGLSEEARLLLGEMVLSRFQLELMRRERNSGNAPDFFLSCDEFQSFAGSAESLWRELLSRGRKFGLGLTLVSQFPGQLAASLQAEIFGNVNSLVSFTLGRKDADAVRRELLVKREKRGEVAIVPIEAEEILTLPVGEAWAKYAGGRAFRLSVPAPVETRESAAKVARESWERYPSPETLPPVASLGERAVREPESFLE